MYAASTFSALVSMNGPNKDTFRRKVSDVRKDTRDSKRHDALTMPNIVMCVCVCVCVSGCVKRLLKRPDKLASGLYHEQLTERDSCCALVGSSSDSIAGF